MTQQHRPALLVDANNVLSRAIHASHNQRTDMSITLTDGTQIGTGALYLFINLISKYVKMTNPCSVLACWDAGHQMRDEIYPDYKANRIRSSESYEGPSPFDQADYFLRVAGITQRKIRGWEADDLIAATSRSVLGDVAILSGDKDLLQLLRDPGRGQGSVVQYRLPDDNPWTALRYEQEKGHPPHSCANMMALVGDTSDGIPGLRKVGPVKATKMLAEADWDWETLLEQLGPEKAAEASLMKSLVDLRTLEYPDDFMLANRAVPPFCPVMPGHPQQEILVDFLDAYRLDTVTERWKSGTLWSGMSGPQDTPEELFSEFSIKARHAETSP